MAEEKETKGSEAAPVAEAAVTEAKKAEKAPPVSPAPEAKGDTKKHTEEGLAVAAEAGEKKKSTEEMAPEALVVETDASIQQSVSFKEESNIVGDLQEPEKKALDDLKQLIQAALANNEFKPPPPPPPPAPKSEEPKPDETPAVESKTEVPVAAEVPASAEDKAKVTEDKAKETEGKAKEAEPKAKEADPEVKKTEPKVKEPEPVEQKTEEPAATATGVIKSEEIAPPAAPEAPRAVPELKTVETAEVKAVVFDEDGAKTVEAIEATVVPVTPPALSPEVSLAAPTETEKVVVGETEAPASEQPPLAPAEAEFIWGVPLLGDEKSDTVLLKFLRARDFKVKDALAMIKNAVIWRKQFGIESLLEEDLAVPELEKVVFYHGLDKEGHPVCYNVYGEFQDQQLYAKAFGDDEKRNKFLQWRIQFLEKGIRQQLDFSPQGVSTMVQVTDLKNVPGPGKKELRQATKKALALLQDNYPEFVAKQVFINVPWWYLAYNRVMSPFFTQRTKSKFVFAGPSRSAETLFRYIAPEQVPVQYGGLSKDGDSDFSTSDTVTEVVIKPSSKHTIELPATEPTLLVWELRVLGWDITYSAEFVPSAEEAYTVLVQKARKFTATDEPFVKNSFKVGEPGKIILTIDNATTKKKKLLYRSKAKAATDSA